MKKKILVTGATGFLGSHLLAGLKDSYTLIGLKRRTSDTWRIREFLSEITLYDADQVPLENIFKEHNIDGIIHAATAYGHHSDAADIVLSNILFPLRLLTLGEKHEIGFFINTDTFFNTDGFSNDYLSAYTLSKKHFVEWLKLFSKRSVKVLNLKLSHVYGPRDGSEKFIPSMLEKMSHHEPKIDLTLGQQLRDFVYVEDVVKVYALAISRIGEIEAPYTELEVGTGRMTSIREFLALMRDLIPSTSVLNFGALPYRKDEIMRHCADLTGLRKTLGWVPSLDIRDGLTKLIQRKESL